MSTTDYTAQAFTEIRTAEAERRLERRRLAAERRAGARRPVAPSRMGFAALLADVLHASHAAASH